MVAGAGYQACDLLRGRYLPRYLVMPATRDSSHRHRARERHLARAGLAAAPDCQECPAALACDGPDAHRPDGLPRPGIEMLLAGQHSTRRRCPRSARGGDQHSRRQRDADHLPGAAGLRL